MWHIASMLFLIGPIFFILSLVLMIALMPRPKIKPHPLMLEPDWNAPARRHLELPEPEFDPLAFWLFPDWEKAGDQKFWMVPPKQPQRCPEYENVCNYSTGMYGRRKVPGNFIDSMPTRKGQPIPVSWGSLRNNPNFSEPSFIDFMAERMPMREFRIDEDGTEITVFRR